MDFGQFIHYIIFLKERSGQNMGKKMKFMTQKCKEITRRYDKVRIILTSFMDEGKSSHNTDTNIKLGLIFRSISARLVTCTSRYMLCPIIQYGLFGGITFEKIISDWIHVIWLFVFTMRLNIFWKLYFCTIYFSKKN